MATTRLMPLHMGKGRSVAIALDKTTDYVKNPEKTNGGEWIFSYECDPKIADEEFLLSKRQYIQLTGRDQGEKDVIAYHLRQSFKPDEINPATANKIGYYVQYRQSGYSKKFLATHEPDILLHKAAKQEFDKLRLEKLPSMDALKTEYATLFSQKNKLYTEYKQARQEMVDLQMAKHNIDRILNVERQAKTAKSVSHEER